MSKEIQNPFPNFHAARVKSPALFENIVQLQELPNGIRIIGGRLKSDPQGSTKPQSYRFPRTKFTVSEAKAWLSDHDIKTILFEPATGGKDMYENLLPKYIRNVTKDSADIFLFDDIGMGGISGQEFADEIKMLNDFGVEEINIHINSGGGDVIEGFSIFSAMTNSKATIHTINEGIAGSMGGIILLGGDKISMVDFSKVMVHNVRGSENPDENELKAIGALQDSLITILTNRTNKTKAEITDMMNAETWLNAKEALAAGFIDEIISSKHKETKKKKRQSKLEIVNILNINNKTETMKKLAKYFDLNEDASEGAILDAIKKITDELTNVKGELETKDSELVKANETIENQKTSIKAFEDKQTELNESLVAETIETAVKDGKFEEKDKEELTEQFKNDLTGLKLIVGKLKTHAEIISNKLTGDKGNSVIPEDKKDWNFRKLEQEAPKLLEKIRNDNVELYKELYENEYGTKYVIS